MLYLYYKVFSLRFPYQLDDSHDDTENSDIKKCEKEYIHVLCDENVELQPQRCRGRKLVQVEYVSQRMNTVLELYL